MPTATTLPLLILTVVLWRLTKGHLLSMVLFVSVFEAASALNFGALGVSPWLFVLALGLTIKVVCGHKPICLIPGLNRLAFRLLLLFLAYAVLSGLVFPFIFRGAMVLNSHSSSPVPLAWGMSNLAQLCYLMAAGVVYISAVGSTREELEAAIKWYVRGCIVASLFSFYQLANATVHVPYPSAILYSNPSHVIYGAYRIKGMWRLNSTFNEASEMAFHTIIGITVLGWDVLVKPLKVTRVCLFGLMSAALLLTLSSLGYLCLSFLLVATPVLYSLRIFRQRAIARGHIVILLAVFGVGCSLYVTTDGGALVSKVVRSVLLDKKDTDSYRDRTASNGAAMESARETYYMGAGWGSVRASGLMYVLMANVGILGSALLAAFIASLFLPLFGRSPTATWIQSSSLYEKSLLALMVSIIGLLAAGAEPVAPILWALFAVSSAGKPQADPIFRSDHLRVLQLLRPLSS